MINSKLIALTKYIYFKYIYKYIFKYIVIDIFFPTSETYYDMKSSANVISYVMIVQWDLFVK